MDKKFFFFNSGRLKMDEMVGDGDKETLTA